MSDTINSSFSEDICLWAYINFRLQITLDKNVPNIRETVNNDLQRIGYEGIRFDELNDVQKQELVKGDAFFSAFQTGNRIVAFALKRSGLDKEMLNIIHESINRAFETVVQEYGNEELTQASYNYTLQTLSVFRP